LLICDQVRAPLLGPEFRSCDLSQPNLRDQLYIALDALRSLPASALNAVSEQLMSGIAKILEKERTVVKSVVLLSEVSCAYRLFSGHKPNGALLQHSSGLQSHILKHQK
jgi:hypothetical protein